MLDKYKKKGTKKGMNRKLCSKCSKKAVAINYKKDNKIYYRSICDACARGTKKENPKWLQNGYKLKNKCDKCGFTSKHSEPFNVYHIDGNLNNCNYRNLKTICANCQRLLHLLNLPWKQGDLIPDFPLQDL